VVKIEVDMQEYNETHAKSGLTIKLPKIETFPNQFQAYTIRIEIPEYTAVCPKTGLPDFGTIILEYEPVKAVLELKSLKGYILAYRNIGIFYENAVNRMLKDFTAAAKPKWCRVTGEFATRGGMHSTITAEFGKKTKKNN
jgi:7-cyano-7-deazaguanine reductase